jgi:hypothetical protein
LPPSDLSLFCMSNVAQGIEWAIQEKVDILSLSFGYPAISLPLFKIRDALERADKQGMIIIASAGNESRRHHAAWPARVEEHVLCANSADKDGNPSDFNPPANGSNHFFARTERIKSTWLGDGYRIQSGTSWSAPALAAFAAVFIEYVDHYLNSHDVNEIQRRQARSLRTRNGMATVFRTLCSMPGRRGPSGDKRYVVDARIAFDSGGGPEVNYDNLPLYILHVLAGLQ